MSGVTGLTVWESIACSGDVRCAESLLFAICVLFQAPALAAADQDDVNARRWQPPEGMYIAECNDAGFTERRWNYHLRFAVHICCALGHVELLEFLLAELADDLPKLLASMACIQQPACARLPFQLGKLDVYDPLAYAVAFNQVALLRCVLPRVSIRAPGSNSEWAPSDFEIRI